MSRRTLDLIDAVRELVDAVLVEHCTDIGTEGHIHEEFVVDRAVDVLKQIRAAPELAALHKWADKRLQASDLADRDRWDEDNTLSVRRR